MTTISLIAAMARNRVIGLNNTLPWHLPDDLKHFKSLTMGKPIIMGRKTFQSLPNALPGRTKIVVSRQDLLDQSITVFSPTLTQPSAEQTYLCHSIPDAIQLGKILNKDEILIIGGGEIFQQSLALVDKMYLTIIDHDIEGDSYFPEFLWQHWRIEEEKSFPANQNFAYSYRYLTLVR